MSIRILRPISAQKTLACQKGLAALRQHGLEVSAFTQFFWTMSVGFDYNDAILKDIFNDCLDDPLPKSEMDGLKILSFWDFSRHLGHHIWWGISPIHFRNSGASCVNHSILSVNEVRTRHFQPTSVFLESAECTPVIQELVKSNVVPESRSVLVTSKSARSIQVTTEITEFSVISPELVELAEETTEAIKGTLSTRQKWRKRKARALMSNANRSCTSLSCFAHRGYSCLSLYVHKGSS